MNPIIISFCIGLTIGILFGLMIALMVFNVFYPEQEVPALEQEVCAPNVPVVEDESAPEVRRYDPDPMRPDGMNPDVFGDGGRMT